MDLDGDMMPEAPRELRGFRRRWNASQASSPEQSGPLAVESIGEDQNLPYDFDPGDTFLGDDVYEFPRDIWDVISLPAKGVQAEHHGVTGIRLFDSLDVAPQPALIQVLDPQTAIEADFKLPWEQEGFAFIPTDRWQGTMLEAFDNCFAPVFIGVHDVLDSQVVRSRPSSVSLQSGLPIVPISLKRARKEQLDEYIRRKALLRFRDLVLQYPLAAQLGTSFHGHLQQGCLDDEIAQSFKDSFRMKAAATRQKRATSLWKPARFLRETGQLQPSRLSEAQLYVSLCRMRDSGAGAATAQHVIEVLQFLDATAKSTVVGFSEVVLACCRGVARDLFPTKDPLQQKVLLTVEQVRKLELSMQTVGSFFRSGISMVYWAHLWLEARDVEGLACTGCVLPSCSEKQACWLETPMNASEATAWSRDFMEGTAGFKPERVGLHSCKTTLLTWAGRCVKVGFSPAGRRLLGHHLDPSVKSFLCYSRESFTTLYSKVLCMFRLIRSGEYCPDMLAIERVVQRADGVGEEQPAMDEKVVEEAWCMLSTKVT